MVTNFTWGNDRLNLTVDVVDSGFAYLAAVQAGDVWLTLPNGLPLVDLVTVAQGHRPASDRLVHSSVGSSLRYRSHHVDVGASGSPRLVVDLSDQVSGISATLALVAPSGVGAFKAVTSVFNEHPTEVVVLRSLTSFSAYFGHGRDVEPVRHNWSLHRAFSDWVSEGRWVIQPLSGSRFPPLGEDLTGQNPRGELRCVSTGTWSTGRYLPVAAAVSPIDGAAWAWQIEHNGAWRWEVGVDSVGGYFAASGPTDDDHQWAARLRPGDRFTSVPVTIAVGPDFEAVMAELTRYRRHERRRHPDNDAMPVVFNDYMNTLKGNPTSDRLEPLIDAAAGVGAEVFCIDAGWYADGYWWDSVGEWIPSDRRFPRGLTAVLDRIRAGGMVPGLWLEPEVIGVKSAVASELPAEAFLIRGGQRVVEDGRYHLDLRHEAAAAHLDNVIDRIVGEYGVGYFKFDYNINPARGRNTTPTPWVLAYSNTTVPI